MDFLKLAESRFSVRAFSDRKVEKDVIEKILRAGQLAPTACNFQPQRIMVLESEEALAKLRKCTRSHFGAPLAMLVCHDRDVCWTREYDGKPSGDIDASIVCTHMMLEAAELGLGSCWVGWFAEDEVKAALGLPDGIRVCDLLPIGYPAENAAPSRMHTDCRSLEETVEYI